MGEVRQEETATEREVRQEETATEREVRQEEVRQEEVRQEEVRQETLKWWYKNKQLLVLMAQNALPIIIVLIKQDKVLYRVCDKLSQAVALSLCLSRLDHSKLLFRFRLAQEQTSVLSRQLSTRQKAKLHQTC